MSVKINEEKDENGNVIARDVEIGMPKGYKDIFIYHKTNYEQLKCSHCKTVVLCMVDKCDLHGSDFICFNCWNKIEGEEWEEEH